MSNTPGKSQATSFRPTQNADGISENHHTGINRLVKLSLVIEGKIIKYYKHFKLKQSTRRHHEFTLTLAHDTLGDRQTHSLEEANKFLGKRLTAVISYKDIDNSPERTFVGVITGVGFSQEQMSLGNIVLTGYSPTILLDGAPHIQSFGGTQPVNVGIIAEEVIKQGIDKSRFDIRVEANNFSQIIYSSQYDETHYNYLARMAEAYGEQFYYDGEVLHFGKLPAQNKPITLTYGSSANDIKVELKAVHTKPQYYGYNSNRNEKLTSGATPIKHVGDLAKTAYGHNESIYKTPALQMAPIKASTHLDVEYSQKSASGSEAVNVFSTSGNTTVPFLHPGCVADVQMRKQDSNETSYFTRIMITEVEHEIDTIGHYNGSFVGIAADTGFLPKPEFTIPKAEPQTATVISNTDPEGQGRIQVRFDWQTNDTTHFIRMMSPDAGGTDQITQNRGYVAIPEVGDQVMVNFVHSHPDRPFVMGGMFHGGIALGGGVNNHLKSIQTRSGIRILMNDEEGSVTILDPSGNTYFMDGQGNISMKAPKNFTLNAGDNINITAGKEISIGAGASITSTANDNIVSIAGKDMKLTASGDITETSDTRTEMIEKEFKRQSETSNEIAGEISMFSEMENMTMQSGKIVEFNSAEKSKLF
ncbi:Vgr family protein [Chryseobacterium sp. KBW03]|jgi:type VI secretion system secreted protein VgrG|uniref:type VI secretion system Vgr family protein n=1 Tax=Chryseobacterium sp. KBW03 TaxID=2153362 RepID=UPI000F5B526D|nr:phage baseplate assembly protein V [Chryseobacterium sp. KBW03]RQO38053.1 Vgr family protein [Chryseobacterium sp. KBW03]